MIKIYYNNYMKELAKFFIFTLPLIAIFWLASLPIYLMVIVIILFAIIGIVWICKYIEEKKKKEEEDRKKYERFFEKKDDEE